MYNSNHYINGLKTKGSEKLIYRKNPVSLEEFSCIEIASEDVVNDAVSAAKSAFTSWKAKKVSERVEIIEKIADWLEKEYGEEGQATRLKSLIHNETGKPIPESDIEVIESADFVRYFCSIAEKELGKKELPLDENLWPTKSSYQIVEPLGVVAIIKPWNYPLEMLIWSIVPALLTGNTIVLKPSEKSTMVGLELIAAAEFAGIPRGVINIVTGDASTGKYLVNHKDIKMVSFTGSVNAGKDVSISCARMLKKCTLELGGNDFAIVSSDADIELTANGLIWGAFTNAGQVCVGIKQVLVSKEIEEPLLNKILEKTKELKIGQDISPLIDSTQISIAKKQVDDAVLKGARLLMGGDIDGCHMKPVIITNLKDNMDIVENECFAPVMPIKSFSSLDSAINIVNSSNYGLGASVWTNNKELADEIANKLDVGMVWHNDVNVAFPSAPWGGRKLSGVGSELSSGAFEEYGNNKHICIENGNEKSRAWWYPYE